MRQRGIQSYLQTGVCLLLCPLLQAQETISTAPLGIPPATTTQPAVPAQTSPYLPIPGVASQLPDKLLIPQGKIIGLYVVDPVTTATATVGSTIRLAMAQDLVLSGVVIARRGTMLTGTIARARRGVAGKTEAQLEIQAADIPLGKKLGLKLRERPTKDHKHKAREASFWILGAPLVVLASPLLIAMAFEDRKPKPTGEDIVFEACAFRPYYVAADTLIPTSGLDLAAAGAPASLPDLCPKLRQRGCNGRAQSLSPGSPCPPENTAPALPGPLPPGAH